MFVRKHIEPFYLAGDCLPAASFRAAHGGSIRTSHHTDAGLFAGKLLHFLQLLQLCDNSKVISKWSSDAGEPSPGEERVVVYTRQEVVGDDALDATSLRLSMTMLC